MKRNVISYLLLVGLMGCGSSSDLNTGLSGGNLTLPAPVQGRTLTLQQPDLSQLVRDGDSPDTLDAEGFDSSGQRVFGPVRIPLQAVMKLEQVPASVTNLQLDYLRNGGYMLFRAEVGVDAKTAELRPQARQTALNDTNFSIMQSGDDYILNRELTGDLPSEAPVSARGVEQMRIKGVCYSPSPINFSNKQAPAVGDLFWDRFTSGPATIWNWVKLWGKIPQVQTRDDVERIRAMGANTIRLYSCLRYQLNSDGTFPDQTTAHAFGHEAFLDRCYNDDVKPISVLVDIPMPDVCFRYTLKEALDQRPEDRARVKAERARQIAWWEANLRATVEDLSKHPAVIGFNIMNEQDGADWSHPNSGQGPDNEETQYFFSQAVKYAGIVKSIDQHKLCGWAFHDSPDLVIFGSQFPANGPKYLEQLSDFDYWGVNSYQTKDFNAIVGTGYRGSYADLPASMKKPVLLTELGWPATGHSGDQLIDTPATQAATADKIGKMYKKVYENPIFLGACYFEFSDEWWKQPGGSDSVWDIGKPNDDFPNGFWDEEGFGLFSVSRSGGRPNDDNPWNPEGNGPRDPYDKITPRQPLIDKLTKVFQSVH